MIFWGHFRKDAPVLHIHGVSCSAVKHCVGREIVGILPNELKSKQREGKMRQSGSH